MSNLLSPLPPDESTIRIGVSYSEKLAGLFKFDKNESLESIIEKVCEKLQLSIPENYCLALEKANEPIQYITEENRSVFLQAGSLYKLKVLPSFRAQQHINALHECHGNPRDVVYFIGDCSQLLIQDLTYASEFIRKRGHEDLVNFIVQADQILNNGDVYEKILQCLVDLGVYATSSSSPQEGSLFSWNFSNLTQFRQRLLDFVKSKDSVNTTMKLATNSMDILCHLMHADSKEVSLVMENVSSERIYDRICEPIGNVSVDDYLHYQYSLTRFIFAILEALEKNGNKRLFESCISTYLQPTILKQHLEAFKNPKNIPEDSSMRMLLSKLQRYILWDVRIDLFQPYTGNEQHLMSFGALYGSTHSGRSSSTDSIDSSPHSIYGLLGFTKPEDPYFDFHRCPPGQLPYLCLRQYGLKRNTQLSTQPVDTDHAFPYVRASRYVTLLLCSYFNVLAVNEIPSPSFIPTDATTYQPLLYEGQGKSSFENIFVEAMSILLDTWNEMNGTVRDFQQVFQVFRTRVLHALNKQPPAISIEEFRNCMTDFRVPDVIVAIRNRFKEEIEQQDLHPAVRDLIEQLKKRYTNLVTQARLQLLQEKQVLNEVSGDSIEMVYNANKRALFIKRANNHEEMLTKEMCANHSVIHQEGRHTIVIQRNDRSKLQLTFPSEDQCFCWSDALFIVSGKSTRSKLFKQQVNTMADIDKRIRLLDLNVHSLPKEAPPVPPLPSNFQCTRDH